jgi:hypothetical protein
MAACLHLDFAQLTALGTLSSFPDHPGALTADATFAPDALDGGIA